MNFDVKKQKAVQDCAFIAAKISLHKESTHSEVLAKCISQVFLLVHANEMKCNIIYFRCGKKFRKEYVTLLREQDQW